MALEAVRGEKTVAALCQEYGVASSPIFKWKKALLDHGSEIFSKGTPTKTCQNAELEKLHATIGKLQVENDFLAKFAGRYQGYVHRVQVQTYKDKAMSNLELLC